MEGVWGNHPERELAESRTVLNIFFGSECVIFFTKFSTQIQCNTKNRDLECTIFTKSSRKNKKFAEKYLHVQTLFACSAFFAPKAPLNLFQSSAKRFEF
jgi:hypothetical protein